MAKGLTERGKNIRRFILRQVAHHPRDLVRVTSDTFGISRQAASRYVKELTAEGKLIAEGATRQRTYAINTLDERIFTFSLEGLEEDAAWRAGVVDWLRGLPDNVLDIWHYGFTEMVNNAIDHSGGGKVVVSFSRTAIDVRAVILDDGIGIFKKIKEECGLDDERHAVFELAKGKLTTAPEAHTGEGIFFTSRMFDDFAISSGDVFFSHAFGEDEDWVLEGGPKKGTGVFMGLDSETARQQQDVFDQFASEEDDYGFTKTVVPVRLARQGAEQLVSRSQAKRLLARVDRFTTVILDFSGVESAGRAFIDEIFRVFANAHPNILLIPIHVSDETARLIENAKKSDAS